MEAEVVDSGELGKYAIKARVLQSGGLPLWKRLFTKEQDYHMAVQDGGLAFIRSRDGHVIQRFQPQRPPVRPELMDYVFFGKRDTAP